MDATISVSKEYEPDFVGNCDGYIPKIEQIAFDVSKHTEELLPIFYEAWKEVTGEDKSKSVKIILKDKEHEVLEIEALLYWYLLQEHCDIKLTLVDDRIVGMCIHRLIYDDITAIRFLYFLPKYRKMYLGKELIEKIGAKVFIFQTQKNIPPELFLKGITDRPQKICESEKLITWSMQWERR